MSSFIWGTLNLNNIVKKLLGGLAVVLGHRFENVLHGSWVIGGDQVTRPIDPVHPELSSYFFKTLELAIDNDGSTIGLEIFRLINPGPVLDQGQSSCGGHQAVQLSGV